MEKRNNRLVTGLLVGLVVGLVVGGFAGWQRASLVGAQEYRTSLGYIYPTGIRVELEAGESAGFNYVAHGSRRYATVIFGETLRPARDMARQIDRIEGVAVLKAASDVPKDVIEGVERMLRDEGAITVIRE